MISEKYFKDYCKDYGLTPCCNNFYLGITLEQVWLLWAGHALCLR